MAAPKKSDLLMQTDPTAGLGAGTQNPLGVPANYIAHRQDPIKVFGRSTGIPSHQAVPPRYFDGDEYVPSTWGVEDRARLQLALRAAGVIGAKQKTVLGHWDDTSQTAYKKLLEYANGAGLSWNEALSDWAQSGGGKSGAGIGGGSGGGGGGERAPLVRRPSNPVELASTFENVYRTRTGTRPPPELLDRMTRAYLAEEAGAETALYNAAETGGTVTNPTDPKLFAQNFAEAANPQGAFKQDALTTFSELGKILGGSEIVGGEGGI